MSTFGISAFLLLVPAFSGSFTGDVSPPALVDSPAAPVHPVVIFSIVDAFSCTASYEDILLVVFSKIGAEF
jgi:hypothetical protein